MDVDIDNYIDDFIATSLAEHAGRARMEPLVGAIASCGWVMSKPKCSESFSTREEVLGYVMLTDPAPTLDVPERKAKRLLEGFEKLAKDDGLDTLQVAKLVGLAMSCREGVLGTDLFTRAASYDVCSALGMLVFEKIRREDDVLEYAWRVAPVKLRPETIQSVKFLQENFRRRAKTPGLWCC